MRTALSFVAGTILFVAITLFEQIPVLGWLGGVVSIAAWVALGREYAAERRDPAPAAVDVTLAGVLGGFTGFVGALTAWGAQTGSLLGIATPPRR